MRYKLIVEYDGTPYHGWQKQGNLPTVQAHLERVIFQMTGARVDVHGSGRTDAGVHATYQVAHFDLDRAFTPYQLREGLNGYLRPEPIVVVEVGCVDESFHARFSARMRRYAYYILNRPTESVLLRNRVWHYKHPLRVDWMQEACLDFLGTHDLSAFRGKDCQAASPIKTIHDCNLREEGDRIILSVESRSFLHHQVRNMVGTLVWIGASKMPRKSIGTLLHTQDRALAGPMAPACGLCLTHIAFDHE